MKQSFHLSIRVMQMFKRPFAKPLFEFEYPFDRQLLLSEFQRLQKDHLAPYLARNSGKTLKHWKTISNVRFPYFEELERIFKIKAIPKFYYLEPNTQLKPHIDRYTGCSINILLTDDEPAPVTIEGIDYTYKTCVLNTRKLHSVTNGPKPRLLFKMALQKKRTPYWLLVLKVKLAISRHKRSQRLVPQSA